jgi:hypothetical protein
MDEWEFRKTRIFNVGRLEYGESWKTKTKIGASKYHRTPIVPIRATVTAVRSFAD